MPSPLKSKSIRQLLQASALLIASLDSASAAYDFKMAGGNPVYGFGHSICIDLTLEAADKINFIVWSQIPEPVTSIENIKIDTGRHKELFSDITVKSQSAGGTMKKVAPADAAFREHPYLPNFVPDYVFRKHGETLYHPGGISNGENVVLSATLSPGRTPADVVAALNEGSVQQTERTGLRVGLIVFHLKGKRRNPMITEQDDAGFTTNMTSSRCRR